MALVRYSDEEERAGSGPTTTIGGAVDHWLAAQGLTGLKVFQKVLEHWRDVVPEEVSRHVTPRTIEERTLVVGVDHAAWATELGFRQDAILKALNSLVGGGALTSLRTRIEA